MLPPKIFYGIKVQRLARPLQDLYVLCSSWATPLLPWPYVLGHCYPGRPIHNQSSVFLLRPGGSIPKFYSTWPCSLAPQYSLVFLYSKETVPKQLNFGLLWPHNFLPGHLWITFYQGDNTGQAQAPLRSLTSFSLSQNHPCSTRCDLPWSSRAREIYCSLLQLLPHPLLYHMLY